MDASNAMPHKTVVKNGRLETVSKNGKTGTSSLNAWVKIWPTPTQSDSRDGADTRMTSETCRGQLKNAVRMFPTPDVRGFTNKGPLEMLKKTAGSREEFFGMTYRAGGKKKETLWPTPRASDADHGGPNSRDSGGRYALSGAAAHRPAPETGGYKDKTVFLTPGVGQLNPGWVEALMGYPQGWTDIEKEDVPQDADFPASWMDGTWEDGIPRTATGIKNRTNRLKCLGNAVVPQIPMMIFMLIIRNLEAMKA
jgi:site-specific DNA-cytosine methylase